MSRKYDFTGETKMWLGHTLHRIRATVAFGCADAGELGGWIEKEENLNHDGNAWVSGNAQVYGDARVYGNAWVYGNAQVSGNAQVYGDARVSGNARIYKRSHWLCVGPAGSRNDFTTFFRVKGAQIFVKCGCFLGDIDAFAAKVQDTHGDNRHAKEYMAAIEMAKAHIDLSGEDPTE